MVGKHSCQIAVDCCAKESQGADHGEVFDLGWAPALFGFGESLSKTSRCH